MIAPGTARTSGFPPQPTGRAYSTAGTTASPAPAGGDRAVRAPRSRAVPRRSMCRAVRQGVAERAEEAVSHDLFARRPLPRLPTGDRPTQRIEPHRPAAVAETEVAEEGRELGRRDRVHIRFRRLRETIFGDRVDFGSMRSVAGRPIRAASDL